MVRPQMRDAAKMKMFGLLTRITTDWCPCSILCKRFNVPEPSVDTLQPGLSGNVKDERAEIAAIEEKNETHLTMEVVEEITQIESSLVTESTSQISPVEHLENLKEELEPTRLLRT
ncbi:hypothetical protein NQ317_014947 [Molorchus minor]|uniref:Uncharacterized protein n=1 Tax=Molorchus minor TaxID=1323400 RepID=A0ABQ9K033_9CUCU|nr:hypothetical protein NQ317_014947 [Molorchus minor]